MEIKQEQQTPPQKKATSHIKFLISLAVLHLSYKTLTNIPGQSSDRGIAPVLWGTIFLIWGVLWFVKLPSLNRLLSIQKITENKNFKRIIKWLMILLILFAIIFTIVGAFDDFIPGLSGKDFFTIMLAPVIH